MKESMSVARTVTWNLLSSDAKNALVDEKKPDKGLHVHVPEGATPKDGPSAGAAITLAMYSLIMGVPVRHDVAMTGEISLQGRITAIGGLALKITGGVRSGIRKFLYPVENQKDFDEFLEKFGSNKEFNGVVFVAVETIGDVMKEALVSDSD